MTPGPVTVWRCSPDVGTSDQMDVPPGMDEVPADQKQRAIGALNADAVAIKAAILDYVAKNGQNGSLSFDDGQGGTVSAQFCARTIPSGTRRARATSAERLPGPECCPQRVLPACLLDQKERQ